MANNDATLRRNLSLGVAFALFLAIFDWGYGYYNILRIAICLIGIYLAYELPKGQIWQKVLVISAVIIWNPVAPIELQKETWIIWDLVFALVFYWISRSFSEDQPKRISESNSKHKKTENKSKYSILDSWDNINK